MADKTEEAKKEKTNKAAEKEKEEKEKAKEREAHSINMQLH